jgi:hypothetical protein
MQLDTINSAKKVYNDACALMGVPAMERAPTAREIVIAVRCLEHYAGIVTTAADRLLGHLTVEQWQAITERSVEAA